MSNPLPADIGSVWKLDEGAQAPRPRRPDEVTEAGDQQKQDYFIIAPGIGVSTTDHSHDGTNRLAMHRERLHSSRMTCES